MAFSLGFSDDVKSISAKKKLFFQIIIALMLYWGNIRVRTIGPIELDNVLNGWLSLPMTIAWVIVVINAINLIDGLDGLAAGVSFFVCIVLIISFVNHDKSILSYILASLAGAILGFLRYNFNPASIFMGDGGSYFLGYMLSAIGMIGSVTSQTAVSILIPMIALGLPLMDTLWATLRRFIVGENIFTADKNHIHHRLISMGFSHRHAVLMLYAMTVFMGTVSVGLVYMNDEKAAILIIVFAVTLFFLIRKSGLIDFGGNFQINHYLSDILDDIGITQERRKFFGHQLEISESQNLEELWTRSIEAFRLIGIEYLEMELFSESLNKTKGEYCWNYKTDASDQAIYYAEDKLYIRFPIEFEDINMGVLIITKDMFDQPHKSERTFKRLDQLRKTISYTVYHLIISGEK